MVSDDQRPDTIHALGNHVIETTHLDRLAARGTAFSRAYAGYRICHVSRAQILEQAEVTHEMLDFFTRHLVEGKSLGPQPGCGMS